MTFHKTLLVIAIYLLGSCHKEAPSIANQSTVQSSQKTEEEAPFTEIAYSDLSDEQITTLRLGEKWDCDDQKRSCLHMEKDKAFVITVSEQTCKKFSSKKVKTWFENSQCHGITVNKEDKTSHRNSSTIDYCAHLPRIITF